MNSTVNQAEMPHVEIYTDGACDPNPGPGGYGAVVLHPKTKKRMETSGGVRRTTNNRMEMYAAIRGLELLKRPCKVTLYSDSQYLVNAMIKGWAMRWKRRDWWRTDQERAVNIDLWERLLKLGETHRVKYMWLRGHAGNKENERCDQLCRAARRQPNLPADKGYENKPADERARPRPAQGEQPCWKCSTPLVKQKAQKRPERGCYYEYYLWCPKCRATYAVEEAKRVVRQSPSLL